MKKIITLIVLFIASNSLTQAQENFKQSLSGIKQVKIDMDAKIKLVAGSGSELIISESKNNDHDYDWDSDEDKQKKQDKMKGMKAVYSGGVDNTGFGLSVEKDGETLKIRDLKSWMQRGNVIITLPKTMNVALDCGNLGKADVEGFSSEIEVNANVGHINLTNVTGPVTAHTSTGAITVKFSNVNQSSPISITSSTGDVDVSLPTSTKANLDLNSTMGTIYTDFDLEIPRKDGMKRIGAVRKIETKLNSGGVNISLRSSTGDVYLRKSNN
jgi:DUF4097 and DUF4098 domain-containing protein YvlB